MFFFTKKQNISLNYYDFPNHFSALCFFYRRIRSSKRNINYILLIFFSENVKSQCYAPELKFDQYTNLREQRGEN